MVIMRPNFQGNKRRKEELRKKKQEEKRNKRLNKRAHAASPDPTGVDLQGNDPGPLPAPAE
jgi:hypothetical protein